jgi:DNA gyrase inhibitor GyrI
VNSHDVKIVNLEPMRAASVYAFGTGPEEEAWKKLVAWAKPKGLLDGIKEYPIFGFNNPNPVSDSSKYGYELWIKVNSEIEPDREVRIIEFHGGPYAVIRCELLGNLIRTYPLPGSVFLIGVK